ncbi:RTA1-domain-containing protein [Ceratobasidium sp. AG-I]|nr:RTA1-domain-containing protein [Ceratobasidium sp. AG-I]
MTASALGYIMAAANGTAAAQRDRSQDLPFHYVPTGWVGITFLVLFGITTGAHLLQAILFRTRYMIPTLVLCGVGELIGWGGRYWGHVSPHNGDAFMMQICTTIISPSFMTAAMFLILPKVISELGVQYSRISPRLYSIIFITADVTALVIQAAGGAMASTANTPEGSKTGGNIMLVGIVVQFVAVILFTILGLEFVARFSLDRPARKLSDEHDYKRTGWSTAARGVVLMLVGLGIATLFIIIRSVYRTIELTDGWNGVIISTEKWFNWFDGMPIVVAMVTFNFFHPGHLLRDLGNQLPPSSQASKDKIELSRV